MTPNSEGDLLIDSACLERIARSAPWLHRLALLLISLTIAWYTITDVRPDTAPSAPPPSPPIEALR